MEVQQGQFVEVRGRPWLVESVDDTQPDLTTLRLSCIADDAQGEQIEVLWDAEIGTRIMQDDTWAQVGRGAPDSPEVLAAARSAGSPPPRPTAICCRPRSGPASGSTPTSCCPCARRCGCRASIC